MTANKQQLREQAESVMHWSSSLTAAWPSDPDFNDVWAVGAIDEDGNRYPVIEVDAADQYDSPGDSEGIAQFFSAASPESVLRLLDEIEALRAECAQLRAAIRRLCNIYVVDDYYDGQMREDRLDEAVNRAINAVMETPDAP